MSSVFCLLSSVFCLDAFSQTVVFDDGVVVTGQPLEAPIEYLDDEEFASIKFSIGDWDVHGAYEVVVGFKWSRLNSPSEQFCDVQNYTVDFRD